MKVKNIKGTTTRKCNCGSWIEHWRNYSNQSATICRAKGCSRHDIVGAHVKKCNSNDNHEYIVPFCKFHNQQTDCIEINDGTILTPANRAITCN